MKMFSKENAIRVYNDPNFWIAMLMLFSVVMYCLGCLKSFGGN